MRILVFGAGVLGSLYAARLQASGQDVTILARGQRAADLLQRGLILENEASGLRTVTALPVIQQLDHDDIYDLVLVLVRRDQLPQVLPSLAANHSPLILCMTNNAGGTDQLVNALGRERVLIGFPGAGGAREGHIVRFTILSGRLQATVLGELSGAVTPRLRTIAAVMNRAGFPTMFSAHMDAWLTTHAIIVAPVALAMYVAGDNYKLAGDSRTLMLLIEAVKEGLSALIALNIPVEPRKIRLVRRIPSWLIIGFLRRLFATRRAEMVMWRHANVAREEMLLLSAEVRALMRQARAPAIHFDRLFAHVSSL